MSISLAKNQTIDLKKSDGGTLTKVRMGLGWDERAAAPPRKGSSAASPPQPHPVKASTWTPR